jgi:hypothetical protein
MVHCGLVRPWGGAVVAVLLALGCAGENAASRNRYVTLRTTHSSQQMALTPAGDIIGPTMQLAPTPEGYRGMVDSALVDLRSDGERITGTIRDKIVDLHVSVSNDGVGLTTRGLFAGRLGRLDASLVEIRSTLGPCTYELHAVGDHYEGQRACGGGNIPMPRPVAIELPAGFERLRPDRQSMLLAILFTQ